MGQYYRPIVLDEDGRIVRTETHPYLANFDKREYLDKRLVEPEHDSRWRIHPLPLLTAEGNGRGGGDFHGDDPQELVGRWARDHIAVMTHPPEGPDWTEIKFNLHEGVKP